MKKIICILSLIVLTACESKQVNKVDRAVSSPVKKSINNPSSINSKSSTKDDSDYCLEIFCKGNRWKETIRAFNATKAKMIAEAWAPTHRPKRKKHEDRGKNTDNM